MDPILHDRLARREQRHASRLRATEESRRLARLEVEFTSLSLKVDGLDGWMCASQALFPEDSEPQRGVITADQRQSDEEALMALADRLWPQHEYLDIRQDGAA